MSIRHTVAFALVGWLLVVPPVGKATRTIDAKAPFSKWDIAAKFENADQCKQSQAQNLSTTQTGAPTFLPHRRHRSSIIGLA